MTQHLTALHKQDPAIYDAIKKEAKRQADHLELIASENYVSQAVLETQGSILTNKYAEGYPGRRYYGGCEHVDTVETLAIERAKQLFQCGFANVQAHSGSQANYAAYAALLKPGDTILAMGLSAGGHLTHGSSVSFGAKIYHFVHYGLDEKTECINLDEVERLAKEHRPQLLLVGFSAYSQIVDWKRCREIADSIGAFLMVDMAHLAGLVAVGEYPSPIPFAHVITSTTHKTLRGPRGGLILSNDADIAKKINSAIFPGQQGGPLMQVIAAKAVAFEEALQPSFKTYQHQVILNAKAMAKVIQARGYAIVSGGTENHLMLIKLLGKSLSGAEAETALGTANITINKNSIPNDPLPPNKTSGIRIGTPAITTRGLKEKECEQVAHWICDVLDDHTNTAQCEKIKNAVVDMLKEFPVP